MNFDVMQSLRSLEERFMVVPVILQATLRILHALRIMNDDLALGGTFDEAERTLVNDVLGAIEVRAQGYMVTADTLCKRNSGLMKLASLHSFYVRQLATRHFPR